jgi:hypothetical protein
MSDSPPLRVIRTFVNNFDAELALSVLEAAGIDAMKRADDCGGVRPHLWLGGIALLVREEDAARADEVLSTEATVVKRAEGDGE